MLNKTDGYCVVHIKNGMEIVLYMISERCRKQKTVECTDGHRISRGSLSVVSALPVPTKGGGATCKRRDQDAWLFFRVPASGHAKLLFFVLFCFLSGGG